MQDPGKLIDDSPMTGMQVGVIGVCFLLNMLDGMDVLAISYAAPSISEDWTISLQALGVVFSAALVGMTIGAIFISPYTDVVGRRKMILASTFIIAAGMVATAFAQSVAQLMVLRLVAGLGIGAMLASLTAMVSEYAPKRHRNLCILTLHAGYPIGAILAGLVASWVLPEFGWRPLFVFAGAVSLIAVPIVFFWLPESLQFLSRSGRENALTEINKILKRMGRSAIDALPVTTGGPSDSKGLRALFSADLTIPTVMLWLTFMMSFATLYFLLSWVVKLAVDSGMELRNATYAGIVLNLGAFFGSLSMGYLSSKINLTKVIAFFFPLGAVMCVAYGNLTGSLSVVLVLIFVLMYFVHGGFTGLYAVAARLYPTEIRTTGVGWAIGAGRIGAIVGPAAAGLILGAGISIGWTFVIFAVPLLIAGLLISRLSSHELR